MRLFTPDENRIIKKIIEIFDEAKPGSLAELQVARLLRKRLNFFALRWTLEPDEVTIYIPKSEQNNSEKTDKLYFDIADFIYFIEELEELGFIKLQNIPSKNEDDSRILYDRKEYTYDPENKIFWQKVENVEIAGRKITGQALVSLEGWRTFKTDFAKDLQRCALSIIYPLPLLRDYEDNKYKTLEQRQYKKQFITALWAAILGGISAIAALGALIYTLATDNKPTTIDRLDLERIEYAIKANHISEPFEIITNDTLVVKPVLPAQNKK